MAWIRALLGSLLVVASLVVAVCSCLYAIGASDFPEDLEPNGFHATPELRALYLDVEAGGVDRVPRLNPVSAVGYWVWLASGRQREPLDSQLRLLGHAGRSLVARRDADRAGAARWHLANLAATIHVSRRWPLERMVDTQLAEGWFGRNAKGIEQAAKAWYGRSVAELVPEERLLLIALMKSPSYYDPTCHPERFALRYRHAATRVGIPDAADALRIALARMPPAACPASRPSPAS